MTKENKTKNKVKGETKAFIHGKKEIHGRGDNKDTVTSVKFDKILGNVAKLHIRDTIFYAEPSIDEEIAGFKISVTPVTQEEIDEALGMMFGGA